MVELFALGDPETMTDREILDVVARRVAGPVKIADGRGGRMSVWIAFKTDQPPGREPTLADKADIQAYAFGVSGVGFWATIEGRLAVTPDLERIVGIVFLSHSETPGLGGRISTERAWREAFRGLDITPDAKLAFVYIDHSTPADGDPRRPRHVHALSGATGTSTAVEAFLRAEIERFRAAAIASGIIAKPPVPSGVEGQAAEKGDR